MDNRVATIRRRGMKISEEIQKIREELRVTEEELVTAQRAAENGTRKHFYLRGKLEVLAQLEANGTKQEG
jgi:DNA-binding winged helix-turn-helix (wHTH) protein